MKKSSIDKGGWIDTDGLATKEWSERETFLGGDVTGIDGVGGG